MTPNIPTGVEPFTQAEKRAWEELDREPAAAGWSASDRRLAVSLARLLALKEPTSKQLGDAMKLRRALGLAPSSNRRPETTARERTRARVLAQLRELVKENPLLGGPDDQDTPEGWAACIDHVIQLEGRGRAESRLDPERRHELIKRRAKERGR